MTDAPILLWFRRDLRLRDNPALAEAARSGRPVVPIFLHDEVVAGFGACPRFRLSLAIEAFGEALDGIGSRLILRRGEAAGVLAALAAETGARDVWWSAAYVPDERARDNGVTERLEADGVAARAFPGHLMFEPWTVETGSGEYYKVFTPFWRSVKDRDVPPPEDAPKGLRPPQAWPDGDRLADWAMDADMNRGAPVVRPYLTVGEEAARGRLAHFIEEKVADYARARDVLPVQGTSHLSENLTWGEISPTTCWHAAMGAHHEGKAGAEDFAQELVWREFSHHLAWHTPRLTHANWRDKWDAFPWDEDENRDEVVAWKRGRTGLRIVDAAMREMFVTGRMHNRARMIVASYLTKHLMAHWRIGKEWFEHCLADWDPANNAMGWQWSAGSGPDATPFFRIFNPHSQADKYDADGDYVRRWLAEGQAAPPETALSYFDAIPRSWRMSPDDPYPDQPVVPHKAGRERALAAYQNRDF